MVRRLSIGKKQPPDLLQSCDQPSICFQCLGFGALMKVNSVMFTSGNLDLLCLCLFFAYIINHISFHSVPKNDQITFDILPLSELQYNFNDSNTDG